MVTKKLHSCSADWVAAWCEAMPFVLGKTEKTQDSYLHCLWQHNLQLQLTQHG